MNTDSGRIYELGEGAMPSLSQQFLVAERLEELSAERDLSSDEAAALEDLRAGAAIVPVADEVAHAQRVGQRELERRRRRRRGRGGGVAGT